MNDFTQKCQLLRRSPKIEKKISKEILLLKPRDCNEYERIDDDRNKNKRKISLNLRPVKQELRLKEVLKPRTVSVELLERRPVSPTSISSGYESEQHDSDTDSCASFFHEKGTTRDANMFCDRCFTVAVHSRLAAHMPLPRTNEAGTWSTHSETDMFGRITCPRLLELYNMNADFRFSSFDRMNSVNNFPMTNSYGNYYAF